MKTISGLKGIPVFGNFFRYQKDRLAFLSRLQKNHGDLAFYQMGSRNLILVAHPDDVAWVMQKNAKNYVKATNLGEVLGQGILTSEGSVWRHQRKLIQPMFHHHHLASLVPLMNEKIQEHLKRLENQVAQNPKVKVSDAMMKIAYEVVGQALFGADLNPHFEELHEVMKYLNLFLTRRLYRLIPVPMKFPLPSHVRFLRGKRSLDRIMYALIDEKSKPSAASEHVDVVSLLIQAADEESGQKMDRVQVRDEAVTLLLAGHETTAQALTWTLYLLAQHPEVQARVIREVDESLKGKIPSAEDLFELPYLSQVMEESMRIHPPVWAFGRRSVDADEIRGHAIPKNAILMICPYLTHRHPDFWKSPETFNPERFDENAAKDRHKFAYFPFGGGPRQCIGKYFAMMEVKLVLIQLFQKFSVHSIPGTQVKALPQVTMGVEHGLSLEFRKRDQ